MPAIASTKEKILETAVRLFYSRGIRATGVDLIIDKAGVHKSTFFKHFPTKREIIIAYLNLRDERWMDWFMARVESIAKTPEDRLVAIFDVLAEWYRQPDFRGCAFINAVAESPDETTIEFQLSVEHKKRLESFVVKIAKSFDARRDKRLTDQILVLIEGSIIRAQMEKSPKPALIAKSVVKALLASNT